MSETSLVKIKDIILGERAREDYGDLQGLSESLSKFGQLQPIVVMRNRSDDKLQLIAGGRRYSAAMMLQWEEIEVKFFSELSDLEKLEIELEENLSRKDFEWAEEVKLTKQITEIKKKLALEKGEKWTQEDSAQAINISTATLKRDLELAEAIEKNPEIAKAESKSKASTLVRRMKSAESRKMSNLAIPVSTISKTEMLGIHKGDSREILKDIPSHSVDLIIADPPYAIEFNTKERNDQYVETYGDLLVDEIRQVMAIVEPVMEECARILKPGGHIYLFFGIQHYQSFYSSLEMTWRLNVHSTPLFWIKKSGENYKPYHRFTVNYESFFFGYKSTEEENPKIKYPMREFNSQHNATFENHSLSLKKKEHPAQKPLSLYKEIISLSSQEGDVVLDPFLGSGISLVAAKQMGREVVGVEMLDVWYELARHNLNNFESYKEGE